MAAYFDLFSRPNNLIRSKSTGDFISLPTPPSDRQVSRDCEVKPGDVLSWSGYRATQTYFVTPDYTLLLNPDTSNAGYLTIPLSITSQYSDAVQYYSAVINAVGRCYVTSLELLPTDVFFAAHFSQQRLPASICAREDIAYSYDPNAETLVINSTTNPEICQYFSMDGTTTNDIIDWIAEVDEPRAVLRVGYRFQGENIRQTVPLGGIRGLPAGWQCESAGASGSSTIISGNWSCRGPEKTQVEARRAIQEHYKGLSVTIS